ncbi:hypothetical protein ACRALDRAFT_1079087 [Sodiomyces alcalophilus JCM 7366]|uniref:uncharacterized protein n=1 Tax=Sodiomyces alcalophilus JCM 7366 TaxID=591952 RepID=UPI0039B40421
MADRSNPSHRRSLTDRPNPSASPDQAAGRPPLATDDYIGLEVDTGDADSALGVGSIGSRTTSLTSSIARYRVENGRTYHSYKDGSYILPNDDGENERLDLQHHICCLTFDGRLYTCPAGRDKPLRRILDAGCGTGIWAIDMELRRDSNLAPGGWIELLDAMYPMQADDDSCPPTKACWRWGDYMNQAAKKLGRSLDSAEENKTKLVEAGFVNVTEAVYKWPINPWAKHPKYKEMGMWNLENVVGGLSGLSLALFTRVLGWTVEELELFLVDVRRDMKDTSIHAYWKIIVVTGQRPEQAI